MIELQLTKGHVAFIDDEDAALARRKWQAYIDGIAVYARATIETHGIKRAVFLHREVMKAPRGVEVDHINGNGLDCRRSNLRFATRAENMRNTRMPRRNTSGFRGVCRADGGMWRALIRDGVRQRHLGTFSTPEAAARAYDAAARELHGSFASLNFPSESVP